MISSMRHRPVTWGIVTVTVVVGIAAVIVTAWGAATRKGPNSGVPMDTVKRGPLTISVTVTGTIRSRQQEIIKNEVEGTASILYLIPEGTRVKKGDLLVEFDASKLQDQLVSQQIVVQNAEAAAIGARETLAVTESQAQSDISKATLDSTFAVEDLKKYTDGDYPMALKEQENKIKLAEEELKLSEQTAKWSERLYGEKYVSMTERDKDRLAWERSKSSVELANRAKELLQSFTRDRELAKLTSNVDQTSMALDRVKRKASADIIQAKASRAAKDLELDRQKSLLEKTGRMISKAKLFAPTEGLVVYATTGGGGFRGDREPLAEGQNLRERQEVIYLPTADSVMAAVKVHESSLDKVTLELPVRVTVDAVPNKVFMGRVKKIAPLPDQQSMWQNPDLKVYNTEIWLEGDRSELRTGMTCRAEILVDYYPDAVYVPVQAVVRVGGKPTVYVPGPDGLVARPVEIGLDNNSKIRILKGLEPGETIALAPPLADAAVATAEQSNQQAFPAGMTFPQTRPAGVAPASGRQPGEGRRTGSGADSSGDRTGGGVGPGRRGSNPQDMTEEQRAAFEARRKQFEAMTPEERQKAMEQMRQGGGRRRGPETAPATPNEP